MITVQDIREKALVFRVLLETSLYMLVQKNLFDPERIGSEYKKAINGLIYVYVEVFRGTPMMVQSMVIYWGYAFATGGKTLDLTLSAIIFLSNSANILIICSNSVHFPSAIHLQIILSFHRYNSNGSSFRQSFFSA